MTRPHAAAALVAGLLASGCGAAVAGTPAHAPSAHADSLQVKQLAGLHARSERQAKRIAELEGRLAMLEVSLGELRRRRETAPTRDRAHLTKTLASDQHSEVAPRRSSSGRAIKAGTKHRQQAREPEQPLGRIQPQALPVPRTRERTRSKSTEPPVSLIEARRAAGPSVQDAKAASQRYRRALALIREHRFEQALEALTGFSAEFPRHPHAGDASYWQGRIRFAQQRYEEAIVHLSELERRFNRHRRLADALYTMALCHERLGHTLRYRRLIHDLRRRFPGSDAARRAAAKELS
ncbi:MAG: tetratricopeptide repeat protein [Proteobacteria bacterium]|nr:tetratricopeptide repeat protein [Pseudomonadota bacterium]